MKIEISNYLKKTKPLLKELLDELLKEFSYASILATDSKGKAYICSRSTTNIGQGMSLERGVVVKVYNGTNYTEYAFNEISKELIPQIIKDIKETVSSVTNGDGIGEISKYEELIEEEFNFSKTAEIEENPEELGDAKIIEKIIKIKDSAIDSRKEILDFKVYYEYLAVNKMFLSPKRDLEQAYMWSNGVCVCVATNGKVSRDRMVPASGIKGTELLKELESKAESVIEKTILMLDAERMVPGEYDVICTPEVTGLIAHEAFGHGVEMDMFVKDRAKSKDYIDKYVASPMVTMHDGAAATVESASYFFDDEGNIATDTVIIENGILKSGINDSLTALALNTKPTANGRRETFSHKAYTRMTNTFIDGGDSKVEDMIASIEYGFLLDGFNSGMEDPKNWGIQCMLSVAKEIKNGKFTGKLFAPVIMTGYVPDLLKSITMLSKEYEHSGVGYCGKGYKEWVKVSDGGPYIKCKARLG